MTQRDYAIAKELKQQLSKVVHLIEFRVFGSRVREDFNEYSDLDVFIEVEQFDKQLKQKMRRVIWEVGFKNSLYISPLFFTRDEIERSPLRVSPIVKNIEEEGVKI